MCFDKTGTITQDELTFEGIHACNQLDDNSRSNNKEIDHANSMEAAFEDSILSSNNLKGINEEMEDILVTAHCVSQVGSEFRGNSVDVTMFRSTGWGMVSQSEAYPKAKCVMVDPKGKRKVYIAR
jgi:magnesium-transporting ATPase (P-type)